MQTIKTKLRLMGSTGKTTMQPTLKAYEQAIENMSEAELIRERQRLEKEEAEVDRQIAALRAKIAKKRQPAKQTKAPKRA